MRVASCSVRCGRKGLAVQSVACMGMGNLCPTGRRPPVPGKPSIWGYQFPAIMQFYQFEGVPRLLTAQKISQSICVGGSVTIESTMISHNVVCGLLTCACASIYVIRYACCLPPYEITAGVYLRCGLGFRLLTARHQQASLQQNHR